MADQTLSTVFYLILRHALISENRVTVKPVLNGHSQTDQKLLFKTNYHLMPVKSIAECSKGEHSAILLTFI